MNLTKQQLIIIAAVGGIVLLFGLIFTGAIPGLQKQGQISLKKLEATINFWGVFDSNSVYEAPIAAFNERYPEVQINYRLFNDPEEYELTLLNAMAAGRGPDIFMIPNTGLVRFADKITPAPPEVSLLQMRNLFPEVIEQNFIRNGQTFALPLSIDTLALLYNKDLFNQASIVYTPSNWDDFENIIPALVKRNEDGNITQAAAAIGGSNNTINNGSHLLELLMLQTGALEDTNTNLAYLDSRAAAQALEFYIKFANPEEITHTWNEEMPYSLDGFAQGKIAMIINYASAIPAIKNRNSFISIGVAPTPQIKDTSKPVTYPTYWGYTVSDQSGVSGLAWEFIISMTTSPGLAETYSKLTEKPPALKPLINDNLSRPVFNVFASQALIAESWPKTDEIAVDKILSDTIDSVTSGKLTIQNALKEAQKGFSLAARRWTGR